MTQSQITEEPGCRVNKVTKYLPLHARGADAPSFIEDDMFTTVVPLAPVAVKVTGEVTGEVGQLLRVLTSPMTRSEIQSALTPKRTGEFSRALLAACIECRVG